MKKVFSNYHEVMHVYAQQTQTEGRSSHVFFHDKRIYSYGYHYLLAEFIEDNVIYINDKGYSSTTAKHIRHITGATRQYKQYFATKSDINLVYQSIKSNLELLAKARKPETYINNILYLYTSLKEYINNIKPQYYETETNRLIEIEAIYSNLNDPTYQAKLHTELLERQRKEKIQQAAKLEKDLIKFFAYEIDSFHSDEDYLRISQNGLFVETSQHVRVDIAEAKQLYLMIKEGREIKGHKIGYYTVISINGTLKIGCHHINMNNVHEIGAKLLNL